MPRKLVCVFGSEFYSDHAESRLLAQQMVRNPTEQLLRFEQAETPLPTTSPKPIGIKGILGLKSSSNKASPPPPYTKAVSGAYGFLSKWYQPEDEIILMAVTGHSEEWAVLYAAVKVLAEHLEAGTEPIRVETDPDPAIEKERDVFNDRPQDEPPNPLLGITIESTVALTYRSSQSLSEINNRLLEDLPLSVKHIFSFNWATGKENYCDTYRDAMGQIISREASYFKEMNWHIPMLTNSTMSFIRYQSDHTRAWRFINPTVHRTLASLPAPLIPDFPSSPLSTPTQSLPTRSKSWFPKPFTKKSKLASRRRTVPTVPTTRSSTLASGFITASSGSSTPTTTTSFSSPSSPRSSLLSSSDLTHSSRTSIDSGTCPTLREAYIQLPGMTRHQAWAYPAFGGHKDDYQLPERVVWRSSRE
ncbi:unnamed protein product [Rhizoctonia solani]|uniref:Uncharacterized protein n=1 Tax=Rhizoctonia solani TaxID=456999 RepID=A0A8H3C4P4_9AGAM|nr:unnamed protein product [Rhizoctonia solani]